MRNIFLFIGRYFNFLLFLILQVLSLYLIVSYSKYHHAMFGSTANRFTGNINKKVNNVEYYFALKATNDSLIRTNAILYNRLLNLQNDTFPLQREGGQKVMIDSVNFYQPFTYYGAKVVANTVASQNNYQVLTGENVKRFIPGMAVVDIDNNLMGKITEIDGDYAVVMGLLHQDSRPSAQLKKTGETGTITWDGKVPNMLTLSGIPKSVVLKIGDTVLTSGMSTSIPAGLLIGRVHAITKDGNTNGFTITVASACNFNSIQFGYAIFNKNKSRIDSLIQKQPTGE